MAIYSLIILLFYFLSKIAIIFYQAKLVVILYKYRTKSISIIYISLEVLL